MPDTTDSIFDTKNFMINILAIFWSIFSAIYITCITFIPIQASNIRVVDTILGFIMGTVVASIIGYFFGSSKSSQNKDEYMANSTPVLQGNGVVTTQTTAVTEITDETKT